MSGNAVKVFAFVLLLAASSAAQEAPHLLTTLDDLARAQAWASQQAWARAARDQVIAAAGAWPQSHLNKYGLQRLELPPDGGQWTLWYVCPVHGVSLRYTAP